MRTGIHFICRDDKGVTILDGERFESRAWRVATSTAAAAEYIALHQRQGEPSYRQGRVISFRRDAKRENRYVFVCEGEEPGLPWPGPTRGGPTMVINRGNNERGRRSAANGPGDDGNGGREPWEREDGTTDWAIYEEHHGAEAFEHLRDQQETDDSLREYMDETGKNDRFYRDPED